MRLCPGHGFKITREQLNAVSDPNCPSTGVEGDRSARRHQLPASKQGNSSPEVSLLPGLLHHLCGRDLNGLAKLEHPEKSGTLDWGGHERWKGMDPCVSSETTVPTQAMFCRNQ